MKSKTENYFKDTIIIVPTLENISFMMGRKTIYDEELDKCGLFCTSIKKNSGTR